MIEPTPTEPQQIDRQNDLDSPRSVFWREQVQMLGAAWAGTIVAAASFGAHGFLLAIPLRILRGASPKILDKLLWAGVGAMYGAGLALVIGGAMCLCAAAVIGILGSDCLKAWIASLIGGWSGFIATLVLPLQREPDYNYWLYYVGVAVIFGQCGAALFAKWMLRRIAAKSEIRVRDSATYRFSLRQLLGLLTILAVVFAVLAKMELRESTYEAIALCAVWQTATILLFQAFARWKKPMCPGAASHGIEDDAG